MKQHVLGQGRNKMNKRFPGSAIYYMGTWMKRKGLLLHPTGAEQALEAGDICPLPRVRVPAGWAMDLLASAPAILPAQQRGPPGHTTRPDTEAGI